VVREIGKWLVMKFRFIVDEDLPVALAEMLKRKGHWAEHVCQTGLRGADDLTVFKYAQIQKATLVTADKGFSDIRRFPIGSHYGIIVLRLKRRKRDEIMQRFCQALSQVERLSLRGRLIVVTDFKVRIR
jgi:predicted nuclease of predicted toxin-antitoxin system